MKRRSFLRAASAMAAGAAFAQQPAARIRLFRLEFFYLQMGDQGARLNRFYQSQMPLLTKHIGLVGVFNSLVVSRNPALMIAKGYTGYDQMAAAEQTIRADAGYRKALDDMEAPSPAYDSADSVLVELADFSPSLYRGKRNRRPGGSLSCATTVLRLSASLASCAIASPVKRAKSSTVSALSPF